MRFSPLDKSLFTENRRRLASKLEPNSVVIIHANDVLPFNGDGTVGFWQNSDLYYLTGINQEETIFVMYPDAPNSEWREMIFTRKTDELTRIWEGYKLTKAEATGLSGIENVQWLSEFEKTLNSIMCEANNVYLHTTEHSRFSGETETRNDRFIKHCKSKFPLHNYKRVAPLLNRLRMVKSNEEIKAIREACRITGDGFKRLLNFVKPGVWEFEIEAELIHEFIRQRADGFAYEPIIAAGANSCVLHYTDNSRRLQDGDVLLLDIAARYANYNSDLTRVLPASGRFTARQKAVYNSVLKAFKAAREAMIKGNTISQWTQICAQTIEKELVDLKLISIDDVRNGIDGAPAYRKYFMHGTGHHLGLVVHDNGFSWAPFEPGMVLTCEPGIYIPEEGLGIRLENNILVTENGYEDLMGDLPMEAEEIEHYMNGGK